MKIGPKFTWTDEAIATLRRMIGENASGQEIAAAIGAPSRSSVIAKAHRLGIVLALRQGCEPGQGGSRWGRSTPSAKACRKGGESSTRELNDISFEQVVTGGESAATFPHVPILDRKFGQCAFPLWSFDRIPVDQKFCCAAPIERGSYCAEHAALCYGGWVENERAPFIPRRAA